MGVVMDRRARLSAPQRREQLLAVAGDKFATHGFHTLSMESIAEAAGVSKPVLYQHFPSKRALYIALVDEATEELQRRVTSALEGTTDNRARVRGAISAFFEFCEDQRFRLLFLTADFADEEIANFDERRGYCRWRFGRPYVRIHGPKRKPCELW